MMLVECREEERNTGTQTWVEVKGVETKAVSVPTATHAVLPEADGLGDPAQEALVKTVLVGRRRPCEGPDLCCLWPETLETAAPSPLFL